MTSATTDRSAVIQQNLAAMAQAKVSPADQRAYLRDIEGVDPDQYLGGGFGAGLTRTAGLAARATVQGLGNLAGLPFAVAGGAYQAATGNPAPEMLRPQGQAVANQMGLPEPQTASERIGVAGAEGVAGSLPFAAAGAVGPVAGALLGAGSGVAGQGAAEAGAGPMGQLAASAAVGMGIPVVATMGAGAIRAAIAGAAARRQASQQAMALLQAGNPNAPVTLGQVAEGGMARTLEGGLRNVPGASRTFKATLDEQAQGLQARTERLANQISPGGTPTTAGAMVQRGIEHGFVPRFRATADALYRRVFQLIPGNTPVIPSSTVNLFTQQGNLTAMARPLSDNLASPAMQRWADDFATTLQNNPQGIPFTVLKEFRSRLGEMLTGADLVEGVTLGDVKRLYGALSDDMTQAIQQTGGAPAMQAWTRAQRYWQAGTDRLERVLQPLMDKRVPEKAFQALFDGSKDGATVLRSTMRSLRPDEKRLVAASVLRRMGKANPSAQDALGEAFSPETYLTRWNQLSPEAKAALFEGIDPKITKDLNRLGQAVGLIRQANRVLPNPSGTASNTAFWGIVNGLSGGVVGAMAGRAGTGALIGAGSTIGAASASKLLAEKVFTNPQMIRWLVRQTTVPFGAMTQQLALLAKDSEEWAPEDRDVAQQLSDTLSHVDWRSILMASAVADASRQGS